MQYEEFEALSDAFNAMTPQEQWNWLVNVGSEHIESLSLLDDGTFINFYTSNFWLEFKAPIGDQEGALYLLKVLGIPVREL